MTVVINWRFLTLVLLGMSQCHRPTKDVDIRDHEVQQSTCDEVQHTENIEISCLSASGGQLSVTVDTRSGGIKAYFARKLGVTKEYEKSQQLKALELYVQHEQNKRENELQELAVKNAELEKERQARLREQQQRFEVEQNDRERQLRELEARSRRDEDKRNAKVEAAKLDMEQKVKMKELELEIVKRKLEEAEIMRKEKELARRQELEKMKLVIERKKQELKQPIIQHETLP